jgi:UDP-N-acetylmuramyl pentapeptide synthase
MIRPRRGIITSIGREHLEHFGTLDRVLEEEGTLAAMLPPDGLLVLDADGFGFDQLRDRAPCRVVSVGTAAQSDWRISNVALSAAGAEFSLLSPESEFSGQYSIRLLGMHQVLNAAYAIVVGKELGLGRADIQRGLDSCPASKMRLELKRFDHFLVLDDAYNANADSMRAALATLESFPCQGRRIAVLGDMAELGPSTVPAHEEIGRRAAEIGIDFLVTVGKTSSVTAQAARGAGLGNVIEVGDVERAGPAVQAFVQPGDVVLIKASRASRLERVVDFLHEQFGSPEPLTAAPR